MASDLLIRQLTESLPADAAAVRALRLAFDDGTGTTETAMAKQNTVAALLDLVYALRGALTAANLTINTARLAGRTTAGNGAVEEISIGAGLSLAAGSLSAEVTPAIMTAAIAAKAPTRQTLTAPVLFTADADSASQAVTEWPGIAVAAGDVIVFKLFAFIRWENGLHSPNAGILFPPGIGLGDCNVGIDRDMKYWSTSPSTGEGWTTVLNANPDWINPARAFGISGIYEGRAKFTTPGTFRPLLFTDFTVDPDDEMTLEKGSYFEFEKV